MYEGKSGPELVTIYNEMARQLGERAIKRFASAELGRKRCEEMRARLANHKEEEHEHHPSLNVFKANKKSKRGKLFSFMLKQVNKTMPLSEIASGARQDQKSAASGLRALRWRIESERLKYELIKEGASSYGLYERETKSD
jgi:hypothetical protein